MMTFTYDFKLSYDGGVFQSRAGTIKSDPHEWFKMFDALEIVMIRFKKEAAQSSEAATRASNMPKAGSPAGSPKPCARCIHGPHVIDNECPFGCIHDPELTDRFEERTASALG